MPDPTEPLPGPEELIDKAARVLESTYLGGDSSWSSFARALAAAGLLADPGLQAELERLREQLAETVGYWQAEQRTAIAMSRAYSNACRVRDERTAERDRLQARVDAALVELLRGGQDARDVRRAAISVLQGDQPTDISPLSTRISITGDNPAAVTSPEEAERG